MRQFLELLRPHALPRLKWFGLAALLGSLAAAFQVGALLLIEVVWEDVLFPRPDAQTEGVGSGVRRWIRDAAHGLEGLFDPGTLDSRWALLAMVVLAALGCALFGAAAHYGFTWLSRRLAIDLVVELRMRLARHLMGLSLRYHGERQLGDLLSRISSDVQQTLVAVNVAFRNILLEGVFALVSTALLLSLAPGPMLLVMLAAPLVVIPVSRLSRKVRRGSRQSQTSLGTSIQALSQMFLGVRTVKSFGGEQRELERYRKINSEYRRSSMRMVRALSLTQSWTAFFSLAGFAILIAILGSIQVATGEFGVSGGAMTTFFLLVARMSNHAKSVTRGWTQVNESMGAAARIEELLEQPVDVQEAANPRRIDGLRDAIRFENVTFSYPDTDAPAVRGLDLELRVGETLALVGESGAGKSTVMDLVARFFDVDEGRITVDGVDLRDLAQADWTRQYAMVGQEPFLFHASIAENIAYGRPDASEDEIHDAARAAGIHAFVLGLPDGYATNVAEMGSRLSGGQRQRITIARALLKGAPLLLLDEATSALDSRTEAQVQAALDVLMRDRTVLVIAHRLSTIKNADRIAVLDEGRLVELGSHAELLARGGFYAKLVSLQQLETEVASS
ncbi:MAG: ABC transporter ATP-binding protein [Planctomycetota bacterium]